MKLVGVFGFVYVFALIVECFTQVIFYRRSLDQISGAFGPIMLKMMFLVSVCMVSSFVWSILGVHT